MRPRYVDSGGRGLFQLGALALNALEDVPAGERSEHLEIAEVLGDQIQLLVVRREHDDLPQRADRRDEPRRIGVRVRAEDPFRVARAKAERARTVIHREHADARAPERTNRRQPVDPTHVDDRSGKLVFGAGTTHRADSAQPYRSDLRSSRFGHSGVTRLSAH